MVEMVLELIEPEALADFQRRGSASASGAMICIGEIKSIAEVEKMSFFRSSRSNRFDPLDVIRWQPMFLSPR